MIVDLMLVVQKDAVSTSHCSQPNNIEYDMAVEWCLLQERADKSWRRLYQVLEYLNCVGNNWVLLYLTTLIFGFNFSSDKARSWENSKLSWMLKSKRSPLTLLIIVGKFSFLNCGYEVFQLASFSLASLSLFIQPKFCITTKVFDLVGIVN